MYWYFQSMESATIYNIHVLASYHCSITIYNVKNHVKKQSSHVNQKSWKPVQTHLVMLECKHSYPSFWQQFYHRNMAMFYASSMHIMVKCQHEGIFFSVNILVFSIRICALFSLSWTGFLSSFAGSLMLSFRGWIILCSCFHFQSENVNHIGITLR